MKRILYLLPVLLLACSCGASRHGGVRSETDLETNSVSHVDMKNAETYLNIYEYLRGRVPGVEVVGTSIRIRGINSITGSNDPLILVDGMEFNDVSTLNPNEIESVDVLKDGTASIYGVRGSNGVILIKLKTGHD